MNRNLKVRLVSNENTIEYQTKCILNKKDNTLKYIENDDLNTIAVFNLNDYTLTRRNSNMRLRYTFIENETTKGEVEINDLSSLVTLDIKTHNIKKDENKLSIEFEVEDEQILYDIEVI